jgi:peptidyl-prolyl isomerase E (cyclophilin E)
MAHVEFEESDDCQHAIFNMNDSEFFGKVISVSYAKPIKKESNKPIWQTEDYLRTVAQPPPEKAGLVRVSNINI